MPSERGKKTLVAVGLVRRIAPARVTAGRPMTFVSFASATAVEIARAAGTVAAVATSARPPTGEPRTLITRPSFVTLIRSPLPKTSIPARRCVHARWWVPSMET